MNGDDPQRDAAVGDAHLLGPLDGPGLRTSCTAPTWPRARPACRSPSTCPPRPATTPTPPRRPARSARSACPWPTSGTWSELLDGIPLEQMNTSMTINATAAWLLGALRRRTPRTRASTRRCCAGTTQNDIVKEYLFARDLHLPARPEPAPDRRHDRVHRAPRAQVEPDQRVQLPPAGGGRDAGAGDRLRAGHRHRRARRRARLGQDRRRRAARRRRPHLLLRQRRHPLRRGDVQDAGLHRAVGPHLPRALRGRRPASCAASATACR